MWSRCSIAPDDCHALRFLSWEDGDLSKNPVGHQMLVLLVGATSSPCCASFALKKAAKDFGNDFDAQTVDTVNHNFYVDDCLTSVATVPDASQLANQLVQLLAKGGFHLTKWISNCREVLEEIPSSERSRPLPAWNERTCLLTVHWAPSGTWKQTRLVFVLRRNQFPTPGGESCP